MAKNVLSDWIKENVPDDALWGEYYVVVQSKKYQTGSKRGRIEYTMCPVVDMTITGREIKTHLEARVPLLRTVAVIVLGIVFLGLAFLARKEPDVGVIVAPMMLFLGLVLIILSIRVFFKEKKASSELPVMSSWESLNPYIEEALSAKVQLEDSEGREKIRQWLSTQETQGEEGVESSISYTPARVVLQDKFEAVNSQLDYMMKAAALGVPQSGREINRR